MAGRTQLCCLATLVVCVGFLGQAASQAATTPTPTILIRLPSDCNANATTNNCRVLLTHVVDSANMVVTFTLRTTLDLTDKWFGIGISADDKMEKSDMVIYNAASGASTMQMFQDAYAAGQTVPVRDTTEEGKLVSGMATATGSMFSFTKPCSTANSAVNRNLTADNYYLWAFGVASATTLTRHGPAGMAGTAGRGATGATASINCAPAAPATSATVSTSTAATTTASSSTIVQPLSFVAMMLVALAQFGF